MSIMIISLNAYATGSQALRWFYSAARTDNYTTSGQHGAKDARDLGYRYVGVEGHILKNPQRKTRTLKVFYNPATKDNYLTATIKGEAEAKAAGYKFVRSEGYVYSSPGKGRKAMKSYFNSSRNDYFTTASATGRSNAVNGGYQFKRVEGYVLIKPIPQDNNTNNNGPVVSPNTSPSKKKPSFEDVPIWRLQLYVVTSDKKNAGTDETVSVVLDDEYTYYSLDKGGNDRKRGGKDYYDILDSNIKSIKDIKQIRLSIDGDDGWNISEVGLIVNEAPVPIYKKIFRNGIWIDLDSGRKSFHTISGEELRSYKNWKHISRNRSITSVPKKLSINKLERMMECYLGHRMNAYEVRDNWEFGKKSGRAYVEGKFNQYNRLKFDLDLVTHLPDVYPGLKHIEREMDVDFYLLFGAKNNKITVEPRGFFGRNSKKQSQFMMGFTKELESRLNTISALGNYYQITLSPKGDIIFN